MPSPLTDIPNIGPATAAGFERAGISDAETLRAMGPDAAYAAFLRAGGTAHFIGFYVLVMGLQGRPWNDCRGAEKQALRQRFDALRAEAKAANPDRSRAFESVLDQIGLGLRRD